MSSAASKAATVTTTAAAKAAAVTATVASQAAGSALTSAKVGYTNASAAVLTVLQPLLTYVEANPHVVAGVAALLFIPFILQLVNGKIQKSAWAYRALFVVTFVLNVVSVSVPGRFDSMAVVDKKTGKVVAYPWETLFAPAGWAFAIWGVIYVGELLLTTHVAVLGKPVVALKKAATFWAAGNLFQSLWCGVFRPRFKDTLWLPMLCLAAGSASLLGAHNEITKTIYPWSSVWEKAGLVLMRSPISLHATWLTAASLLNLNGWAAVAQTSVATQTAVAFFSSYLAAAAGTFFSVTRGDPLIAFTVAWALAALSARTLEDGKARIKGGKKGAAPLAVIESLALTEKVLSRAMVVLGVAAPTLARNLF